MDEDAKIDEQDEGMVPRNPTPHNEFQKEKKWSMQSCLMWGIIFVLIFIILTFILMPLMLGARRAAWQPRAKGTLRSIGSSQLSYQGTNNARNFASFEALKRDLYIAKGYTLGNMIENYSMKWEVYNVSTVMDEYFELPCVNTFSIIAYPRDRRPGYLSTFAITEDQVVRVYNPEGGNDPGKIKTWDPVL